MLTLNLVVLVWVASRNGVSIGNVSARSNTAAADDDLQELARMYEEDQADRTPAAGKNIDWSVVLPRDRARLARVKELYSQNKLQTARDYYHAAMMLQHGGVPEDYLLAHEFCVVAIGKGDEQSKWLAAASEDRFLMNIDRPQRFGTQYRSDGPNKPVTYYKTDPGVTDDLRQAFHAPTLADAKAREAEMNKRR